MRIDSIPLHGHLTIRCCPNNKIRHITTTLHCDGNLTHSTYAFKTQAYDIARTLSHNLCPAHTAAHCAAPIVIISHNGQYSLKYMHFSRWGMRSLISERVCEISVFSCTEQNLYHLLTQTLPILCPRIQSQYKRALGRTQRDDDYESLGSNEPKFGFVPGHLIYSSREVKVEESYKII